MPKSGYIDAFDFKSPKDLADYLIYLSENRTAYNSYFKWKKHVSFFIKPWTKVGPICDMCIQLHLEDYFGVKKKSIKNVTAIWNANDDCNFKKEYFKYVKEVPYG